MRSIIEILQRLLPPNLVAYLSRGHQRSVRAKKSIIASLMLKGVGMTVSFLLVPLMLDYLNPTRYGIWLTLNSTIALYGFVELGLGQGMRNKFAEAIAHGDHKLARTYISTAYILITTIMVVLYVVFLGILPMIDWVSILKAPPEMAEDILRLVLLVFSYFSLQMVFKLMGVILTADQKPAIGKSLDTGGSLLSLGAVYLLSEFTEGSLWYLGIAVCISNLVIKALATFWFFGTTYRKYFPTLSYVNLKYAKPLMGLGLQFFAMQFAGNIVFSTDNLIITQLLGPELVTPYNLSLKYFSLVMILFNTVTLPLWSAYTEAYVKGELQWIRDVTNKFIRFWLILLVITVLMVFFSPTFFHYWVGDEVQVPMILSAFMAAFVLLRTWSDIFYYLMYGASKIKLSLYVSIIASIVNIPLSVFLAGPMGMGISGVILGTCLTILPDIVLAPVQYRMLIRGTAKGIWNQ